MSNSLLNSSKFEILTSKRTTSVIYGIFAAAIFAFWVGATIQFVNAYNHLHEFDVSVTEYISYTILFLVPMLFVGVVLAESLIKRVRLNHWFKTRIDFPEYATLLKPAEVGFIADYDFGLAEIEATLLDLHFRQVIIISTATDGIHLVQTNKGKPNYFETILLQNLFFDADSDVVLSSFDDLELVNAGEKAHDAIIQEMQTTGTFPKINRVNKSNLRAARFMFYFGGFIGLFFVEQYFFNYTEISTIVYPRFPVSPVELWLDACVSLIALVGIIRGFWPRFSENQSSLISMGWIHATGFKEYLSRVFGNRLDFDNVRSQDVSTVEKLSPYMVAFGLVKLDRDYLNRLLEIAK